MVYRKGRGPAGVTGGSSILLLLLLLLLSYSYYVSIAVIITTNKGTIAISTITSNIVSITAITVSTTKRARNSLRHARHQKAKALEKTTNKDHPKQELLQTYPKERILHSTL